MSVITSYSIHYTKLYEAAVIDGASRWKQMTKITVPLIAPVIIIMTLLAIGRIFNADFGLFYQATIVITSYSIHYTKLYETFLTSFYLDGKIRTIPMLLGDLQNSYGAAVKSSQGGDRITSYNVCYTKLLRLGLLLGIARML